MTSPNTDLRGVPINIGTTVIYLQPTVNHQVKVTEGTVIEILENQFVIQRLRQWAGSRTSSYCTDRPTTILKHKCWVVPDTLDTSS